MTNIEKLKSALWKLDHTICMNNLEGNLKFNIDSPEDYIVGGGYDPNDTDCKSIEEAIDCLEALEKAIDILEAISDHYEFQEHPDPFFWEEMPERILIDLRKIVITPELINPGDPTENNKKFDLVKEFLMGNE